VGFADKVTDERFWSKVEKTDGCWNWIAFKNYKGYGAISIPMDGRSLPRAAHKVSWVKAHGDVPDGLCVLHKCDNRACVNPAHLFLGTPKDNSADMVAKGRQNRGEKRPLAKLGEEQIRAIRAAGRDVMTKTLAAQYGISSTTVGKVRNGRRWTHVA
jgi:hypothetical protein